MEKSEVIERVNAYLEIARVRGELYAIDRVGLWEATSLGTMCSRIGPIYHGSFLEVVATAVEYGDFCTELSNTSSKYKFGCIKEIEIKELARNFNPADLEEKVEN